MLKTIFILLAIVSVAISYVLGGGISYSEQWPLYESLRTTAAIVFGVMGAWIAIIYPQTLIKVTTSRDVDVNSVEYQRVRKLMMPMVCSTAILCAVLIVGIFAPLLGPVKRIV